MRVMISAISARSGGGLNALRHLVERYRAIGGDHRFDVFVTPAAPAAVREAGSDQLTVHVIPGWLAHKLAYPYMARRWMPWQARRLGADAVLTLSHVPIATEKPQLIRFAWAYAVYPEVLSWPELGFRGRWDRTIRRWAFRRGLRHIDCVAVQTETIRRRMVEQNPTAHVAVVPMAVTPPKPSDLVARERGDDGTWRLLCLSHYYAHKNLEVLVDVARLLEQRALPVQIQLTIDADESPRAAALLDAAAGSDVGDHLISLGKLPHEALNRAYAEADGFILPTRLESFSVVYCDAMARGMPVLTSDRDFARDVCGDAGWYFDPLDAEAIVATIEAARTDAALRARRVAIGRERVTSLPTWDDIATRYLELLEQLVAGRR